MSELSCDTPFIGRNETLDLILYPIQQMTHHYKVRRHDGVVDAVLLAALESDLVACREVAKHFQCPLGSGEAITHYT